LAGRFIPRWLGNRTNSDIALRKLAEIEFLLERFRDGSG
jgi:hypothetical protein